MRMRKAEHKQLLARSATAQTAKAGLLLLASSENEPLRPRSCIPVRQHTTHYNPTNRQTRYSVLETVSMFSAFDCTFTLARFR